MKGSIDKRRHFAKSLSNSDKGVPLTLRKRCAKGVLSVTGSDYEPVKWWAVQDLNL